MIRKTVMIVCCLLAAGPVGSVVEPSGTVLDFKGSVNIRQEETWEEANQYQPVYEKNIIKTSKDSIAEIMFDDETVILFEEGTEAEIKMKDGVPEVSVKEGRITSSVVPGEEVAFFVSSPLAIIGVRGTEFTVTHSRSGTNIAVFKGKVEVEDRTKKPKKIKVRAGKQSFVYKGKRPSKPVGLSPAYKKYRKTVLKKFVKRTLKNRKNRDKILLQRMNRMKKDRKKIIKKMEKRNDRIKEQRKKQTK